MGSFASGVHVRTSAMDEVGRVLAPHLTAPALAAASGEGWVTAFLDDPSLNDPGRLAEMAATLATALGTGAVGFAVYDGDVLALALARDGREPRTVRVGSGIEAEPGAAAAFADAAAALCRGVDEPASALRRLIEGPSPGVEEERLAAVDALLGIDPALTGHTMDTLRDAVGAGEVTGGVLEIEPPASGEAEATLFRAIERGDDDGVREALEGGADPNARVGGATALARALAINHMPSVHRLLEAGATPDMEDVTAALNLGDEALLQAMTDGGWDVDAVHPRGGYTALYLAALLERRGCLRVLLSAGADVDRRFDLWEGMGGRRNVTALWGALTPGILDDLLTAGADPDPADARGVTPLMLTLLSMMGEEHCWTLAGRLVQAGADPRRRTTDGRTALDLLELQISVYERAADREWSECRVRADELARALGMESDGFVERLQATGPGRLRALVSALRELAEKLGG